MAVKGISARWTSSATTCLPSSSAVRSLKTVPDFTKGVRRPATIATRRPGREAMGTSRGGRRYSRPDLVRQARLSESSFSFSLVRRRVLLGGRDDLRRTASDRRRRQHHRDGLLRSGRLAGDVGGRARHALALVEGGFAVLVGSADPVARLPLAQAAL